MDIIRHIPNTITSMNLLCGVLGVIVTFQGHFDTAFILMLTAAVCDFFDGFAARLLKAYSDIGKELDSLADMVSFGLLPSLMLNRFMIADGHTGLVTYIPLVICIFSALRLAKFNVDDRQTENFLGLATPACAMWCGSMAYFFRHQGYDIPLMPVMSSWYLPAVSAILALLLVSEIPMFSLKFKKGSKGNVIRTGFLAMTAVIAVTVLVLHLHWSLIILISMTLYILYNVLRFLASIITIKKN